MRRTAFILAFTAFSCAAQQTSVLFIGNSYTYSNDLPNTLRLLALSLGDTITVASSAPGGFTFQQHSVYAPTLSAINQQGWDFVVLQEQSQIPSFSQGQVATQCYPYAAALVDSILANDPCTQPVFFMTWGRQNGDASNCATWPPVCTYEGMQAQLRTSYLTMAQDNDAFCAPMGIAWKNVRAAYPQLNLYVSDGSHPSGAGTYVIANALYATLFRSSTVGASHTMGLAADTALFIQQIASATVLDSLDTWNIGVNDPDASFTFAPVPDACKYYFTPAQSSGVHFWDFGDGTTSTEPEASHYYEPGTPALEVTHTVTDDCGRTGSSSTVLPSCVVGVIDIERVLHVDLRCNAPGSVITFNPDGIAGSFFLLDAQGRTHASVQADHQRTHVIPAGGLVNWRFISSSGTIISGRLIIL